MSRSSLLCCSVVLLLPAQALPGQRGPGGRNCLMGKRARRCGSGLRCANQLDGGQVLMSSPLG
ncbi:hypothetical protein Hsero_3764 [Herbaspirillum seropedicae SmR1]|uniref:Transmembrane protein n=1 Tax=Herbaspirillum seropedicae (strain SmR1) TaxID=757424 RepID=D8IRB6_HERSS|nr:hypothetical protein Hsero_3764 [Herbaspirillum seropedicae SmR1]